MSDSLKIQPLTTLRAEEGENVSHNESEMEKIQKNRMKKWTQVLQSI